MANPLVGIIMGSKTDLDTLQGAVDILKEFGVEHEVRVLSAHRTPEAVLEWSSSAEQRGLEVPDRGRRRRGAPAGRGGGEDDPAGARRAGAVDDAGRGGRAALDRADAARGAGGDARHRQGGGRERRAARNRIMAGKRPELREKLRAWRKARADEVVKADASVRGG